VEDVIKVLIGVVLYPLIQVAYSVVGNYATRYIDSRIKERSERKAKEREQTIQRLVSSQEEMINFQLEHELYGHKAIFFTVVGFAGCLAVQFSLSGGVRIDRLPPDLSILAYLPQIILVSISIISVWKANRSIDLSRESLAILQEARKRLPG
jgi:hypothetical protein